MGIRFTPETVREESPIHTGQRKKFCFHCKRDDHSLNDCKDFLGSEFDQRKTFLRENRICFNCLESTNHIAKRCVQKKHECATCTQRHATALHDPQRHPSEPKTATKCTVVAQIIPPNLVRRSCWYGCDTHPSQVKKF